MGMNRNHPVTQSEVLARIEAMPFALKRQYWLDWKFAGAEYPFREWLHQRAEVLIHAEADKWNEDAGYQLRGPIGGRREYY